MPELCEWRDVVGYEGFYKVSNFGQVKGVDREVWNGTTMRKAVGVVLKQKINQNQPMVNLNKNSSVCSFKVAVLVLTAFGGIKPEGMECCHEDGNPLNNIASNLRWDTHQGNMLDMVRHGTGNKFKLNKEKVAEIRELYATGRYTQKEVGAMFGVGFQQVKRIVNGKQWRFV